MATTVMDMVAQVKDVVAEVTFLVAAVTKMAAHVTKVVTAVTNAFYYTTISAAHKRFEASVITFISTQRIFVAYRLITSQNHISHGKNHHRQQQ